MVAQMDAAWVVILLAEWGAVVAAAVVAKVNVRVLVLVHAQELAPVAVKDTINLN